MSGEEGLLTNQPKFHGDRATTTIFLQHCCDTYPTDLVIVAAQKINKVLAKHVPSEFHRISRQGMPLYNKVPIVPLINIVLTSDTLHLLTSDCIG